MDTKTINVGINLTPDGAVVLDGDHAPGTSDSSPFDATGVSAERVAVGRYEIAGPAIAWPEGWRASVFRDENDEPTVRLALGQADGRLTVACTDRTSGAPMDIVYLLTLRVAVTVPVVDPEPAPAAIA